MQTNQNTYSPSDYAEQRESSSLVPEIDFQHYVRILRKHKWLITFFTALVTALAAYYAYTATPIYRATSTLLIESQRANVVSIDDLLNAETESGEYYETQFELLRSRQLASRVVRKMGLVNHPEFADSSNSPNNVTAQQNDRGVSNADEVGSTTGSGVGEEVLPAGFAGKLRLAVNYVKTLLSDGDELNSLDESTQDAQSVYVDVENRAIVGGDGTSTTPVADTGLEPGSAVELPSSRAEAVAVRKFQNRLTVSPVRRTKLVKISFESADPNFAAQVANTVSEEYILAYLDSRMELANKVSSWMNERVGALKSKLDESEGRLQWYKESNQLVDVNGSVSRVNEQELILATTELAQTRSDLSAAANLRREVRSMAGNVQLLESIPEVQNDPLVSRSKVEIGQQQRELDELSNRYGPRHPRIIDAESRVRSLETTLQKNVLRVVDRIEKDFQLLNSKVASIQSTLNAGKQEIQNIGSKKVELEALEREVATNRGLYETYFNQLAEAESSEGIDATNARVADYALPSNTPVRPKKQLIIALAALAALGLSMLMAFLFESMDETIKSTEDVEKKLGVKLLGVLPLVKNGIFANKMELPLNPLDIKDKKGTFFEAVNTIRTSLSLADKDEKSNNIIMVTSSVPGEGKSTTALNLAFAFSQLDKTLVIDCDLRRPTIGKSIELDKDHPGLSSLLMGTARASEAVVRGGLKDLDVLPAGPLTDQPLELLSSPRMQQLLETLRQHYDRIILDCAPCQAVSDALVLSKHVDALVYSVKSHSTQIQLVERG